MLVDVLELREVPARHLAYAVIERRLEARGGGARHAVADVREVDSHRELRRDVPAGRR